MARRGAVALAVLVLLAGAFLVLRQKDEQDVRADRKEARLLQFDERKVEALILSTDGVDWRFERVGSGWRLRAPVDDAGDDAMIERLLVATQRSRVARVIEEPDALADYGLDPPVASVRVEGVVAPRLDLGDADPTREGMFARVEGRPGVLVLELPAAGDLYRPQPAALRLPTITALQRKDLRAVTIGAARLERVESGWWFVRPHRIPASDVKVDRMLGALEAATIFTFGDHVDRADPRFGLGSDSLEVVLEASEESRTVHLGAVQEGLRFVTCDNRQTLLAVEAEPLDVVSDDVRALAEDRLTKINRYGVVRFVYRAGGEELQAGRNESGDWTAGDGSAIEEDVVYGLLARLLEARISGFERGAAPAGSPSAALELELEGGEKDRIDFFSTRQARVESLPDLLFDTVADPPQVPRS